MTSKDKSVNNFRLPSNVRPIHYDLVIAPYLETGTFEGSELIEIEVSERVASIKLNTRQVSVLQAHVQNEDGTKLFGFVSENSEGTEITTISFNGLIAPGKWKLFVKFSGKIGSNFKGIYKSTWTDDRGIDNALAVTQFCATDARRAFPCFDEPAMKATFKLTLIVDSKHTALSNSKEKFSEKILDGETCVHFHAPGLYATFGPLFGKKRVQFETTMKMSTYLLAFVVGKLQSSRTVTINGTELTLWCTPQHDSAMMDFALEAAKFGISWFEEYFQITCPGDGKIDLIAVPDHAYGAMENLGCITFREQALLVDPETASASELKRVAGTTIHELAHMWFGDLVTMRWWNGVWLNEAFATFMQKLCTAVWKPEWGVFEDFALERAAASDIDALKSTHPIEAPVHHPDDASEMFDVISYEKGCSILYQLHEFIGANVFRDGIRNYLQRHAYGSTETHDLWDSLEEACQNAQNQVKVRDIMDAWVFTPGHPVLTVSESDQEGCVSISQSRFSFSRQEDDTLYPVPVIVKIMRHSGAEEEKRLVLTGEKQTVFVGDDVSYLVVNTNSSGFYRVVYSENLVERLFAEGLESLSVVERFNIINDSFDAVRAGLYNTRQYLKLVDRFVYEFDSRVWQLICQSLSKLRGIVPDSAKQEFKDFVCRLITPTVRKLGWQPVPGEPEDDLQTRMYVLPLMVTICDDETTVKQARGIYELWKESRGNVSAEVLTAALDILAHGGDQDLYSEFVDLAFNDRETPQVRERFLIALAEFQEPQLIAETLSKIERGEVQPGLISRLVSRLMANSRAQKMTWKFFVDQFDTMVEKFPEPYTIRLIRAVSRVNEEVIAREINQFFNGRSVRSGGLAIAQTLEQVDNNVSLKQRESALMA